MFQIENQSREARILEAIDLLTGYFSFTLLHVKRRDVNLMSYAPMEFSSTKILPIGIKADTPCVASLRKCDTCKLSVN